MQHAIDWFEIPVLDMNRAMKFYETMSDRIAPPNIALPDGMGFIARIMDTEGNRVGLHTEA